MRLPRSLIAVVLCYLLPTASVASESQGYSVTYSGGSLPTVKGGEDLRLRIESDFVRLSHNKENIITIPAASITEVSYGQEVHRRIGTAAGLAVVSLGIGAIVAFSKSKKHYVGVTWADGNLKGGIVLQADKNEYRGVLTALEGVSGRKAVDADASQAPAPVAGAVAPPPSPKVPEQPPAVNAATILPIAKAEVPEGITVRFTSTPSNAEVSVDGVYWGTTPTTPLKRLTAGTHTVTVKKIGHKPWERKIELASGDDRTVSAELEVDPTKPQISGLN